MTAHARPVIIEPYRAVWATEFVETAHRIRTVIGDAALRVDHIGSTSVPGLGAKDIIDVQISIADLEHAAAVTEPLRAAGFSRGDDFVWDLFHGLPAESLELRKRYMREPAGDRRVHLHIREQGRFNQQFALLFRDYLRASTAASQAYEHAKRAAAAQCPYDIEGYLRLKAPIFANVYQAATSWAARTAWVDR